MRALRIYASKRYCGSERMKVTSHQRILSSARAWLSLGVSIYRIHNPRSPLDIRSYYLTLPYDTNSELHNRKSDQPIFNKIGIAGFSSRVFMYRIFNSEVLIQ